MPHFVYDPDDMVIDEIVVWEDEGWVAPPKDLYDDQGRKFMSFYSHRDVIPAQAGMVRADATTWADKNGMGLEKFIDRLGMTDEPKEIEDGSVD